MQAGNADHRVDLVERAIGLDAQVVFFAPLAGAQRRGAVVAPARIDSVKDDHVLQRPIAQIVAMITMMAMNCSSTRRRISFCDVCGDPPRIMLARPSTSTIATAMMAIGTRAWDMKSAMGYSS